MPTSDKRDLSDAPRVGPMNCSAEQAAALLALADEKIAADAAAAEEAEAPAPVAPVE